MPNDFRCDLLLTGARYLSSDMAVVSGKAIAVKDGKILDIVDQDKCAYQAETVLSGSRLLWIIAFYHDNKILVKRVIAGPGDWVDIDESGTVYVNEEELYEPYLVEKALGDCDIALPYQVPESKIFVMGDHRSVSLDSRNTVLGCVAYDQIVGRLLFRVWPHQAAGLI